MAIRQDRQNSNGSWKKQEIWRCKTYAHHCTCLFLAVQSVLPSFYPLLQESLSFPSDLWEWQAPCGGDTKWAFQAFSLATAELLINSCGVCAPAYLFRSSACLSVVCLSVSLFACLFVSLCSGAAHFLAIYWRGYVAGLYLSSGSVPQDSSLMANGAFILISVMIIHPEMKGLYQPPAQWLSYLIQCCPNPPCLTPTSVEWGSLWYPWAHQMQWRFRSVVSVIHLWLIIILSYFYDFTILSCNEFF